MQPKQDPMANATLTRAARCVQGSGRSSLISPWLFQKGKGHPDISTLQKKKKEPQKHNLLKFPLIYMNPDSHDFVDINEQYTQVYKHTTATYAHLDTTTNTHTYTYSPHDI